jgi:hypothetical protein
MRVNSTIFFFKIYGIILGLLNNFLNKNSVLTEIFLCEWGQLIRFLPFATVSVLVKPKNSWFRSHEMQLSKRSLWKLASEIIFNKSHVKVDFDLALNLLFCLHLKPIHCSITAVKKKDFGCSWIVDAIIKYLFIKY